MVQCGAHSNGVLSIGEESEQSSGAGVKLWVGWVQAQPILRCLFLCCLFRNSNKHTPSCVIACWSSILAPLACCWWSIRGRSLFYITVTDCGCTDSSPFHSGLCLSLSPVHFFNFLVSEHYRNKGLGEKPLWPSGYPSFHFIYFIWTEIDGLSS